MKYYDIMYLFGNGLDTLIIYLFPGETNYYNIIYICITTVLISVFGIFLFPKVHSKKEK